MEKFRDLKSIEDRIKKECVKFKFDMKTEKKLKKMNIDSAGKLGLSRKGSKLDVKRRTQVLNV